MNTKEPIVQPAPSDHEGGISVDRSSTSTIFPTRADQNTTEPQIPTEEDKSRPTIADLPPLSMNLRASTTSYAPIAETTQNLIHKMPFFSNHLNVGIYRSKSSFSIPGLDTKGLAEKDPTLGMPSMMKANQQPNDHLSETSSIKRKSPNDEKLFKDVDPTRFSGVWNHPMTRYDLLRSYREANSIDVTFSCLFSPRATRISL